MFKEFTSRGSRDWITILPALIDDYNNSMHRTIGMTPTQADAHPSRVTLKRDVVKTRKIKFHVGDKVRISVYKGVFTKGYLPNWSTEIFTIIKVNKTTPSTFILRDYTGSPIAGGFYAEEIRKTMLPDDYLVEKHSYRVTMDAFGGSPDSRLNKSIADMEERFEKELASHVKLIEINLVKIDTLGDKFANELAIHSNVTAVNEDKIWTLGERTQVIEMKIMHLKSLLVPSADKYFSENNNKIESLIKSVEIASKSIEDLKTNLTSSRPLSSPAEPLLPTKSSPIIEKMAFLQSLKAQVNCRNLSVGDLDKDVPYTIRSMKNVDTKFGTAVSCMLADPEGVDLEKHDWQMFFLYLESFIFFLNGTKYFWSQFIPQYLGNWSTVTHKTETYGDAARSERTCREWFQRFKNGDFDVEDKHGGGREKTFKDEQLEALLDEDSCQTQEKLAELLGVSQQAISKRLKALGMIQKEGNWVPYELKPRDIERRLFVCEQLLQRQNRKGFLHRIVTGDEKWVRYDNPKRRKSWGKPGHASSSKAKPNIHGAKVMICIWWDQLGVIYYELLKPGETITGDRYRTQLMRLSRALKEKRPQYQERHDKVILQHDNARPHVAKVVKKYLETLKWEVLPHPPYSPDVAPSDFHLFRSMAHGLADQHFQSFEELEKWIASWIASKEDSFFRAGIRKLPERWEKVVASDGQYFE
ncbi:hypothetical protein QTP88_024895 [Uroleucon formosanum]